MSKVYLNGQAGHRWRMGARRRNDPGLKITSINQAGVTIEQAGRSIDLQLYPR
jgi:hypothetical protein